MSTHNLFRKLVFWIVVAFLLYLGVKGFWSSLLSPVNASDVNKKSFVIQPGETTSQIVDGLAKSGLIRNSLAFELLIKESGQAGSLQAGEYDLAPSMSGEEVLKQLSLGAEDKKVTLLEGWRSEEIAAKLQQDLGIDQDKFMQLAKEGYMFPDTYQFAPQASVEDIVGAMEANFNQKFNSNLKDETSKRGLNKDQAVILASIVEREARSDQVRQKVASILLKRLNIGMALDADSTVQYALGYQKDQGSWWKHDLTLDDLKVDSPFNTYLHSGLPPQPICNPSLSSLQAVALADPSTPYLYYYHDSQGNSYYAQTLEEHNQNIANHP